jgi:hypothetical protein
MLLSNLLCCCAAHLPCYFCPHSRFVFNAWLALNSGRKNSREYFPRKPKIPRAKLVVRIAAKQHKFQWISLHNY